MARLGRRTRNYLLGLGFFTWLVSFIRLIMSIYGVISEGMTLQWMLFMAITTMGYRRWDDSNHNPSPAGGSEIRLPNLGFTQPQRPYPWFPNNLMNEVSPFPAFTDLLTPTTQMGTLETAVVAMRSDNIRNIQMERGSIISYILVRVVLPSICWKVCHY